MVGEPGDTFHLCTLLGNNNHTANVPRSDMDEIKQRTVQINTNVNWTSDKRTNTILHEIGHALGIGHETCTYASYLMSGHLNHWSGPITTVDFNAQLGATCLYGSSKLLCELNFGITWLSDEDVLAKDICPCSKSCGALSAALGSSPTGALTYELSISDDDGPFAVFDTLQEADWVDGRFAPQFMESHTNALVRMRVYDGEDLIAESITPQGRDIVATTDANWLPMGGTLLQATPSPTTGRVRINLRLRQSEEVGIAVHDVSGRRVASLLKGHQEEGSHQLEWDPPIGTAPGVYFVVAHGQGWRLSRTVV
jgi:hypothetical protein